MRDGSSTTVPLAKISVNPCSPNTLAIVRAP
jgi:hypothetical protein